mmetsp:Transcript_7562/g.15729  ORF Transcript_7562/g.15729 Transcript_7562/m.15729 type:complete len:223 (+) Transcript_7562:65-733(+)
MPRRHDGPGPGAYEVSHFESIGSKTDRGASLKSGSRNMHIESAMPGPGDYAPGGACQKAPKRCLFGKSNRFLDTSEDKPGPCEYTPRNPNVSSERKTIGEKNVKLPNVSAVTPGPGAYTPLKNSDTVHHSTNFGGGARRWAAQMVSSTLESPGPAAYQHEHDACGKRVPAPCFGTSPRIVDPSQSPGAPAGKSVVPGPGQYHWDLKPHGPKVSITPRREQDW